MIVTRMPVFVQTRRMDTSLTPNYSLNRTARRRRLLAVRSRPVSLARWASGA